MIGQSVSVGDRPHRIRLQGPGTAIEDPDGGYVSTPADLDPPEVFARIMAAPADLERTFSATIVANATHVIDMPFHPGLTTATRILFRGRTFSVIGFRDREERQIDMIVVCAEQLAPQG